MIMAMRIIFFHTKETTMRVVLLVIALFGFSSAVPVEPEEETQNYIYYQREDGTLAYEDLTNGTVEVYASASDLTYYYYSRNRILPVSFKSTQIGNLRSLTDYDPNKMTLFVIHGWTNSYLSAINRDIRTAALSAADINVIVVDWSPISIRSYLTAQLSVTAVGNFAAAVIQQFNSLYGQSWDSITVAGFSLGAHIAGVAGAACGGRIGTLVGLDPAGPGFTQRNTANRIDPTDGVYVQIIHTNDGGLGYGIRMGHSDFYPNGGRSQSGCTLDLTGLCDHNRSYQLYAESLTSNRFLARECSSYTNFRWGLCSSRGTSVMGGININRAASGEYYLSTNSRSPYATGTA